MIEFDGGGPLEESRHDGLLYCGAFSHRERALAAGADLARATS